MHTVIKFASCRSCAVKFEKRRVTYLKHLQAYYPLIFNGFLALALTFASKEHTVLYKETLLVFTGALLTEELSYRLPQSWWSHVPGRSAGL